MSSPTSTSSTGNAKKALGGSRSANIEHPIGGSLAPVRIGIRVDASSGGPPPHAPPPAEFAADQLAAGTRRIGSIEIGVELVHHAEAATLRCSVRNVAEVPVYLDAVIFGFRWRASGSADEPIRFLRQGWQSWSYTGVRELDAPVERDLQSHPWLRGMHHARNATPADRAGWHESATVGVVGRAKRARGGVCLVGALETGRAFSLVYLRRQGEWIEIEIEQLVETPLAPGDLMRLEDLRIALGDEPSRLLESFATLWGRAGGARASAPFQAGWCSWYYFFHEVCEDDILRNLEALAKARDCAADGIPIEVVQLDDGYQRAVGDWLLTNQKFPSGLAELAQRIRDAGFRAGIWTAPFCVVPESLVFDRHPDWLLRWGNKPFRGTVNPIWSEAGAVYALDTAREDVREHLRSTFRQLVEMGFDYLKLDFLHCVAMRADSAHPELTRAARLRAGLEAIRAGAGDEALLLGCGSPLGPAVGIVDAMRIGPDVAPHWEPAGKPIPGLEAALPSTHNAVRSVLCRSWMHRRLWLNDPDCLMARSDDTQLSADEAHTLATAIATTGGMVVMSDDLPDLSSRARTLVRETIALAREVDAAAEVGAARCADLLACETPEVVWTGPARSSPIVAILNTTDSRRAELTRELEPGGRSAQMLGLSHAAQTEPLLHTAPASPGSPGGVSLGAHESALFRVRAGRELAIFCDFDGTFSLQDVGATIATAHAGASRARVRDLFLRGDITAWESNIELLDGLPLPESTLNEFLHTIELDPGAAALVQLCSEREVPFRILSDGFDYNLDRLQEIHGVEFRYAANRLRYRDGRWCIEPGHPNPACGCGTGTCKRAQIDDYRSEHPGAFCVHIGNGRVSDLCGALAADLAFAKDTLAPALEERGERYLPYKTLHDVVRWILGELRFRAGILRQASYSPAP